MASDDELERLGAERDRAFQRKQDAWQVQDSAWKHRQTAQQAHDDAYDHKERQKAAQNSSWERCQAIRVPNNARIDRLKQLQETAYQNMVQAFSDASSAYAGGNGAAAKQCSTQGNAYKAESQRYVEERRTLVAENQAAKRVHDGSDRAFQDARRQFNTAKAALSAAKAEHERARDAFNTAKREFETAKTAFQSRLDQLKSHSEQRKYEKQSLAAQAGVPGQYQDSVYVSHQPDGTVNIYFGGLGEPNGYGHGHYVIKPDGKVTYQRNPFQEHGAHNFTDEEAYIAQEKKLNHKGGYGLPTYGSIDGKPVTFAAGWGTQEGQVLIADGHVNTATFKNSANHNHYGPGDGPRNNAKGRGKYTGPDA